jgi:GNAT superfamily N-acetyltransferase
MIRVATHDDVDAMVEAAVLFLQESSFSRLIYNKAKTATHLHDLMDRNGFAVIYEKNGNVIGGMVGDLVQPWFSDDLIGIDLILYIHSAYRRGKVAYQLIKAWQNWCIKNGARQLRPVISTGQKAGNRLYEAMGFEYMGGAFLMDIQDN